MDGGGLALPNAIGKLFLFDKFLPNNTLTVQSWERNVIDDEREVISLDPIPIPSAKDDTTIFAAKGEILHDYTLPVMKISKEFQRLDSSYHQLQLQTENHKNNIGFVERTRKKVKNLVETLCLTLQERKRAIITGIIIAIVTAVAASAATAGVAYAVGAFNSDEPITKDVLMIQEDVDKLEAKLEKKEIGIIENLGTRIDSNQIAFEHHLLGHQLEDAFDRLYSFIVGVLNPEQWDFSINSFLEFIQEEVAKSGLIKIGTMFGGHPISTLLLLSNVKTEMLINTTSEEPANCNDLTLRTRWRTVIPSQQAAKPTENARKFLLDDGGFLWVSPQSYLSRSRLRTQKRLSWNRNIRSDEHIPSVLVVNNTQMIIHANITALIQCEEGQKEIYINGTVLIQIPLACQLISKHLNISSYKVISLATKKVLTVGTEDLTLHYHQELQNISRIENLEEKELTNLMAKIIEEKQEIIDMEREVIEQDDGLLGSFRRFWSGLSQLEKEVIYAVILSLVLVIVIIILCIVLKKC